MRLSFQTVCIIFGVTLVHLIIITALSPVGVEGTGPVVTLPEISLEEISTSGEMVGVSPSGMTPLEEGPAPEVIRAETFSEPPLDSPARPREEGSSDPAPGPVLDAPAMRRSLAPLPRS